MNTNRVSATLLTADQEAVMTALGVIRQKLPFLIDLTTAERVILPKLGDKTQPFVKKAVDIARQHPELLPAGFLEEMRKDAQLLESLSPIRLAIDLLQKQIYSKSAVPNCWLQIRPPLVRQVYCRPGTGGEHPSLQFIHTFIDRRYGAVYLLGAFFRSLLGGSFALSNFQHTLTPD